MNKELIHKVMTHIDNIAPNTINLDEDVDVDFVKSIRDQPAEYWNQSIYIDVLYNSNHTACQTAACFAGWTLIFEMGVDQAYNFHHGSYGYYEEKGAELLGLTISQAYILFHHDNSLSDLHFLVSLLDEDPDIEGVLMAEELRAHRAHEAVSRTSKFFFDADY